MSNIVDLKHGHDPILRCIGAGRDAEATKALVFYFDRKPTDDEMRYLHDVMRRAAVLFRAGDHGRD